MNSIKATILGLIFTGSTTVLALPVQESTGCAGYSQERVNKMACSAQSGVYICGYIANYPNDNCPASGPITSVSSETLLSQILSVHGSKAKQTTLQGE